MRKIITLVLLFMLFIPCCNASKWAEIFEKQYVDFETIELYPQQKIIKFWVKKLRKDPEEKFLDFDYWYTVNKWALSCNKRFSRIESVTIYDLKQNVLYSDSSISNWEAIIPDTYAEGYYKLFCLIPFSENPLFNNK